MDMYIFLKWYFHIEAPLQTQEFCAVVFLKPQRQFRDFCPLYPHALWIALENHITKVPFFGK